MIKTTIATLFALTASTAAFAENQISVFYTPHAEFDAGPADLQGDGFGISGKFNLWKGGRIDIDHSVADYDKLAGSSSKPDFNTRQTRLGYNVLFGENNAKFQQNIRVEAAYFSVDNGIDDASETGFGVHAGVTVQSTSAASFFAEAGYLKIDDAQGPEINVGFDYRISPIVGFFTQYRGSMLAQDGTDVDLSEFRIGGKVFF